MGIDFPLDASIKVAENASDIESAVISNSDFIKSEVCAWEIDFYIKNSQDDIRDKIVSVSSLYNARLTAFESSCFMEYEREISNRVLVVSNDKRPLMQKLKENAFTAVSIYHGELISVEGSIGMFKIEIKKDKEVAIVEADQIVFYDNSGDLPKKRGFIDADTLSDEEIISSLKENMGICNYENSISYNSSICQHHLRREDICGKCTEACQTSAIVKDSNKRELIFSHIDCNGCGECISVCPSGSLDFTKLPHLAFLQISRMYKNKIALIIPETMQESICTLDIKLPKNILPLVLPNIDFLHEAHLITLLQECGAQAILYSDKLFTGVKNAIYLLNEIYKAKYKKKALFVASNEEELKKALLEACFIPNSVYDINEEGMRKREIFSARLSYITGNEDLGVVRTNSVPDEIVRYGYVKVDESRCTLCLSCVGACNVGALKSYEEDFSLRLDNSVCTTCKYCELTCPEKCIEVVRGELPLNKKWFTMHTVAKDEPCYCAVCKKPYATKRSVEKIANMLKTLFISDEAKLKTLYCCADCKAKVMIEAQIKQGV
jgi:ferredoxin